MARKRKLEASPSADRGELRRLLEAAKADYHDDGPRLGLADWLEEHGGEDDRARAEVIRLQLDTANGGPAPELVTSKGDPPTSSTYRVRLPYSGLPAVANKDILQASRGTLVHSTHERARSLGPSG